MIYFVRDEHTNRRRQVLTLWSGQFASDYEGTAVELPKHNGFMVTLDNRKVRVECESPRTDTNFIQVDDAINTRLAS